MTQPDKLDRLLEELERRNTQRIWPSVLTIGFSIIGALISAIFYLVIIGGQTRMEGEIKSMRETDIRALTASSATMSTKLATFETELGNIKTQINSFNDYTKQPRFSEDTFRREIAPLQLQVDSNRESIKDIRRALEKIEETMEKKQ
jgi:hypothetical protein